MLEMHHADVYYGKAQALHDVSLEIRRSQILALVGRNGAGKSTILKSLMGQIALRSGARSLDGKNLADVPLHDCSRLGIALVPEDRQIFAGLSCRENLDVAGMCHRRGYWTKKRIFALFPRLQERADASGTSLSGGEQQMLAIGRALMTNPRYLLLDEPTEGLAPLVVEQIIDAIEEIRKQDTGIVLVEQNFRIPQRLAQSFLLVDNGAIAWRGKRNEITDQLACMLTGMQPSPGHDS